MNPPILETVSLSRYFAVKPAAFGKRLFLKAVDDVNLRLHAGESLGLAGESGCGKSTLARLLIGLIPPSGGEIKYHGRTLDDMGKEETALFRKDVQMIFQDPFSSLNPRMRVGEIIGEPLAIHRLATGPARRARIQEIMQKVGLSGEHFSRYPHEFSGGQRQRIGIARALAVAPRIIIADEPVSALDLSIQAQIINLLQELQAELGLSYLFIAHDLSVVRHLCTRIAIMYLGRIVEIGGRNDVFNKFLHPYTEALIAAIPGFDPGARTHHAVLPGDIPSPLAPPSGCPFHTRCPYAELPLCATVAPLLEEKETGHFSACHLSIKLFRH